MTRSFRITRPGNNPLGSNAPDLPLYAPGRISMRMPGQQGARLLRLIALPRVDDASIYSSVPASPGEFPADEEPLAWDSKGWQEFG